MKVVGLTGGIATGKSIVATCLAEWGAYIIDADKLTHNLLNLDTSVGKQIVTIWGERLIKSDNTIDREKLALIVFSNPWERKRLEAIVHPAVIEEIKFSIATLPQDKKVVLVAPLLIEANATKLVDEVWLTYSTPQTQIKRLMARDGLSPYKAWQRITAQHHFLEKLPYAKQIINTEMPLEELKKKLKKIWEEF